MLLRYTVIVPCNASVFSGITVPAREKYVDIAVGSVTQTRTPALCPMHVTPKHVSILPHLDLEYLEYLFLCQQPQKQRFRFQTCIKKSALDHCFGGSLAARYGVFHPSSL